jgi:predicted methyltransferase
MRLHRPATALLATALLAGLVACATHSPAPAAPPALASERIAAIVASPDRSDADRTNDLRRHPAEMLAFIGVHPNWVALDVSTGGGYTTELLARAIGPGGSVFGQSQPRDPNKVMPKPAAPEGGATPATPASSMPSVAVAPRTTGDVLEERARKMKAAGVPAANIFWAARRFDNPVPPELADAKVDLVTLTFNYHDFGFLGVDRAQMNRAIFQALKPGGLYVIADHAGRPGTGISESGTLHRVEESFLRAEVEAAGFKLAQEGNFLRNPNDPRDQNTPNPPQPKDEFVLKFVKP